MTMISNLEKLKELKSQFSSSDVEWRVGSCNKDKSEGLAVPYVTNRAIQQRLDQVVGEGYWKNKYIPWHNGSQLCEISIKVIYEDGTWEWIDKVDGAECSEIESIKGGLSDSMKRAAVQWGIGRYLYEVPNIWIELKDKKYIPAHELKRLNAFIDGDSSAQYSSWHDKKGKTGGNSSASNTNTSQNKKNNSENNTINSQKSNNNSSNVQNSKVQSTNSTSTSVNLAQPGQITYLRNLLAKTGKNEADLLKHYNISKMEELTITTANSLIKSLSKIS